jgi:site-specific recombinase XerD
MGLHGLRHFRISEWIRQGLDVKTVQVLAGHRSIATTEGYIHFNPDLAFSSVRRAQEAEARERLGTGGKQEAEREGR